jgi:ferrous iron transport protein B
MSSPSLQSTQTRSFVYALVGNPNCGKSTLFNALTGLRQKVGNYPGVTVEKKIGTVYSQHGTAMAVIDLPGSYSLASRSPDEAVTRDVLLGRRLDTPTPDRILCVVDATSLERSMYLVHQILDLGRPMILIVNMMDLTTKNGLEIDIKLLSQTLGIPVIATEATKGKGLIDLKLAMSRLDLPLSKHAWSIPVEISSAVAQLQASLTADSQKLYLTARAEALLLLTDQAPIHVEGSKAILPRTSEILKKWQKRWQTEGVDWSAVLVQSRYDAISSLSSKVIKESEVGPNITDRIDAVVTHPLWGWLVLGFSMTLIFLSIFSLAEYPMNWIDSHVTYLGDLVRTYFTPGDLRDLVTDGVIAGVGSILVFLPQILVLFFFIGLLESTGYMARAAFIMDRLMNRVGLNGRSFIPMLSSYACAIPGIMATRTIEDEKDRLITILVAPLMSCSARLPVYLLMMAALVPTDRVPLLTKAVLMVVMYTLGTLGAFGFAWLFKRTLLKGPKPKMIMELPPYHLPHFKQITLQMIERAWIFLRNAGSIILTISIVLWFLSAYPKAREGTDAQQQLSQSFAGRAGHLLEPIIKPIGFDWRIGIGLISSFAAREVFVSSTAVVFSVNNKTDHIHTTPLRLALRDARWPDGRLLFTPLVCLCLMIYYVFAMQCMSTVAVVKRETNSWKWPLFQIAYMTGTAWVVTFIVYNVGSLLGF